MLAPNQSISFQNRKGGYWLTGSTWQHSMGQWWQQILFRGSLGLLEQSCTDQLDLGHGAASLQPGWISSRPVGVCWAPKASRCSFPGQDSSCVQHLVQSSVSICFPPSVLITFARSELVGLVIGFPFSWIQNRVTSHIPGVPCVLVMDLGIVGSSPCGWATPELRRTSIKRTVGKSCVAKPEIIQIFSTWKVSLSQSNVAYVFLIENGEQLMRLL